MPSILCRLFQQILKKASCCLLKAWLGDGPNSKSIGISFIFNARFCRNSNLKSFLSKYGLLRFDRSKAQFMKFQKKYNSYLISKVERLYKCQFVFKIYLSC